MAYAKGIAKGVSAGDFGVPVTRNRIASSVVHRSDGTAYTRPALSKVPSHDLVVGMYR